jgi:hypothetical protein
MMLPLVILLHLILLYGLLHLKNRQAADAGSAIPLFLSFPIPKPQPPVSKPEPIRNLTPQKPAYQPPARTTSSPTPPNPTPEPTTQDSAAPLQQLPVPDLISSVKRDIGKIDKELRKDYPKLPEKAPDSLQAKLEKGIANAYMGGGQVFRTQERIFPDGKRVTKVFLPGGGSFCVTKSSAGDTDGLDQIQRGVYTKVTNCGHLFD